MVVTDDALVQWLTSCLDEIERVAREATPGPWRWGNELCWSPPSEECNDHRHEWGHSGPDLKSGSGEVVVSSTGYDADQVIVSRADAIHIVRHDPRSVLARVEAERALVVAHSQTGPGSLDGPPWGRGPVCLACAETIEDGGDRAGEFPCRTLRLLAYGHRHDHPGYDPAWAPEGVED